MMLLMIRTNDSTIIMFLKTTRELMRQSNGTKITAQMDVTTFLVTFMVYNDPIQS